MRVTGVIPDGVAVNDVAKLDDLRVIQIMVMSVEDSTYSASPLPMCRAHNGSPAGCTHDHAVI